MHKPVRIVLFGVFVWLVPFVISVLIFPLRESESMRPLFESIMPVIIAFVVVFLSLFYFRSVRKQGIREGVLVGVVWFVISIVFDLFLFLPESSLQMGIVEYMSDIGIVYLLIPIITIGFGFFVTVCRED